jgi:hypothetical protein
MKNNRPESNKGQWPANSKLFPEFVLATDLPDGNGGFVPCPELLTEEELIAFLRIPEVSNAEDYHNVVENLKRMHGLPRIHVCGKPLYPIEAIKRCVEKKTIYVDNRLALELPLVLIWLGSTRANWPASERR